MMDEGHAQNSPILGYRDLSQAEIELINQIKSQGSALDALLGDVRKNIADTSAEFGTGDAEHYRWVSIAHTHLQQGLMALTRAVAKPTSF
jgi:hypothetical protein